MAARSATIDLHTEDVPAGIYTNVRVPDMVRPGEASAGFGLWHAPIHYQGFSSAEGSLVLSRSESRRIRGRFEYVATSGRDTVHVWGEFAAETTPKDQDPATNAGSAP